MKVILTLLVISMINHPARGWGFYAHQKINYYAVFLLPPAMLVFYKPNIEFIVEHSVDPDKRRYAISEEGPRHYIDMDRYGAYPYPHLPRKWEEAVAKFGEDSLHGHGIVPWWIQVMYRRLVLAFKEKDGPAILKLSAEIAHYIADAHVPLHTSSNHDGQHTNQKGIHGFWESRIPELLAEKEWDFFMDRAAIIKSPLNFIWTCVLESAASTDSVLVLERELSFKFPADNRFAFEARNGIIIRQYSSAYAKAYDHLLNGMIERRMRASIFSVASFWYTAWVDAGQPDLAALSGKAFKEVEIAEMEKLNAAWRENKIKGRPED